MALCALTLSSDSKGHLAAAGAQIALWPINTLVGAFRMALRLCPSGVLLKSAKLSFA